MEEDEEEEMEAMNMKRCRQCGELKLLTEFVRNGHGRGLDASNPNGYRARCSVCEVTNRTEPKADRRERHKARDTRARHAKRFAIPISEMDQFYGWNLDRIEADIIAVRDHGCARCRTTQANYIPRSLDDIHIDILDPAQPPFYGINTAAVCKTCNLRKGSKSELRLAIEEAERQAIIRRGGRPGQLSLFDGVAT